MKNMISWRIPLYEDALEPQCHTYNRPNIGWGNSRCRLRNHSKICI